MINKIIIIIIIKKEELVVVVVAAAHSDSDSFVAKTNACRDRV